MPVVESALKIPFLWDLSQLLFGCNEWKRKQYRTVFAEPGRMLDFGCADGNIFPAFKEFDYYGIDTDKSLIEHARKRYASFPNAHFIDSDILERPFSSNFFDSILFGCTGHHLSDNELVAIFDVLIDMVKKEGAIHFFDTIKAQGDVPALLKLKLRFERGGYMRNADEYQVIIDSLKNKVSCAQTKIIEARGGFTPQPDYLYAKLIKRERSL